ncbi:MAG: hypothetical protein GY930_05820 [bacterium]|nr:hypothetical protein [bacterium]
MAVTVHSTPPKDQFGMVDRCFRFAFWAAVIWACYGVLHSFSTEWVWRLDFITASGVPLAFLAYATLGSRSNPIPRVWAAGFLILAVLTMVLSMRFDPSPTLQHAHALMHCVLVIAGLLWLLPDRFAGDTDAFLLVLVLLSCVHLAILFFLPPIFNTLQHWFWIHPPKPIAHIGLPFAMAGVSLLVAFLVLQQRIPVVVSLLLLVGLGTGLQYGFALLEGRGLTALEDRITLSGHAEFATIAVQQGDIPRVLVHYEELLESGELGQFAKSKPPGVLLFYMLTDRVAGWLSPEVGLDDPEEARLQALRRIATYTWPLFSLLVLIPLFLLARLLLGENAARVTCLLYTVVPSANLITLHTDQVLFPLFFVGSLYLSSVAFSRNRWIPGLLAGACSYLAIYLSFALILTAPFMIGLGYLICIRDERPGVLSRFSKSLLAIGLGALALDVLFRVFLGYDAPLRNQNALAHHAQWKQWTSALKPTLYFAALALTEFSVWVGVPVALLAGYQVRPLLRPGFWSRVHSSRAVLIGFGPVLFSLITILALLGKTKGEVARLWLFLMPLACMAASITLTERYASRRWATWLVFALQWITVLLIKTRQDFW